MAAAILAAVGGTPCLALRLLQPRQKAMVQPRECARWVGLFLLLLSMGCVTQDDARVQTLLNQRGFGRRYVGDTNEQYYLGIGDALMVLDPGHPELNGQFVVRVDGVIDVPMIGEIYIAGLTLPDVAETLTRRFQEYITSAHVDVQLAQSNSKWFYVDGQVAVTGRIPFRGATTLYDVVFQAGPGLTADKDNVRLIRADPVHPLVVLFDYDDMAESGYSRGNVEVRENDIVYVPPNFFGYLSIFLQTLLAPVQETLLSIIAADRFVRTFETFGDTDRFRGRNRGRSRFGGVGIGGIYGTEPVPLPASALGPRAESAAPPGDP